MLKESGKAASQGRSLSPRTEMWNHGRSHGASTSTDLGRILCNGESLEQEREVRMREHVPEETRIELSGGANEVDLVRSGLWNTMADAYEEMLVTRRLYQGVDDLRTAAYLVAINKVANSYAQLGIFP